MGKRVRLTNATISYPNLFVAKTAKNSDKKKYSAAFILDKDDPNAKLIEAAMEEVKAGVPRGTKLNQPSYYDGDTDREVKDDPRNAGKMVLRTSRIENQGAPCVFDKQGLRAMDSGLVYAGCKVNADVDVYHGRTGGHRICFGLVQVQFAGDGERLDGSVPPEPFDPIGDADVDDLLS